MNQFFDFNEFKKVHNFDFQKFFKWFL